MAGSTGPNTATDGLVFAFDTTNEKSFVGEPTVNLFPEPTYTSTDGQVLAHTEYTRKPGQGYDGLDSVEGVVSSSYVSGQIARRWSINLPPGFYTHTFYVKKNCDFFRIEHLGTAIATSGGATQQAFNVDATAGTINAGAGFTDYGIEDRGDWWKVWYVIEIVGSGNAIFDYEPLRAVGNRFEFCGSQIEAKTHPTPFVNGTRSSTESLLDQTRNDLIDITDTSFNSDAQIIFDGTDDKTIFNTPHDFSITTLTYELVFKGSRVDPYTYLLHNNGIPSPNTGNSYCTIGWYNDTPYIYGAFSGKYASMYDSTTPIDPNLYYHVALTWDGEVQRFYINGEEKKSMNLGALETPISPITSIGGYRNASIRMFDGQVPITRIYTKTLSAEEIKQNFEAIRNKFEM